jgi:LmbE family N-acetylglucosaminyl deacetylase
MSRFWDMGCRQGNRVSLRLLCVFAHPDDECFAFGGALALAADRGVEIFALCLTKGTSGSYRGGATSDEELGRIRSAEFAASCKILGITRHELLDFQDGQLEHMPLATLVEPILQRMRSFQPHVVLTFGMDGAANTHADHTCVSAAATAAFHWAGREKRFPALGAPFQPQHLFHQTTDFFLPDRPRPLPLPWTLKLDITSVFDRKAAAFLAHTTQGPLATTVIPLFEQHGKYELYALVASPAPHAATQSTDMFEGVTE